MKYSNLTVGVPADDQQPQPQLLLDDKFNATEFAKAFFDVPVLLSHELWELCVAMNYTDEFRQNFRIKSLLVQSKNAIKNADQHLAEVSFDASFRGSISGHGRHRIVAKAVEIDWLPALLLELDNQPRLLEVAS